MQTPATDAIIITAAEHHPNLLPRMATDQEHYLAVLKASYDYDPQPDAEDELAIKQDQLLFLLERIDEDWWKVKIKADTQEEDGASGLVPSAYVEAAEPTSVVKVLYDYEAAQLTELTVKEDEILNVYGKDDDWFLVQSQSEEGKIGYVPGNYVEETTGSHETPAPASTSSISQIVVPDSPPRARPASTYVDPADRVAAAPMKTQADSIQTWAVSEVDKKGKKKKGTLGVGNGAMFFASESDKTPVQQWKTSDIQSVKIEKSKHVHIEVGGADAISLHYHAGGKDTAEAIVAKLESSRSISGASTSPKLAAEESPERPRSSAQKSVHFDDAADVVIPSSDEYPEDKDEVEEQETPIHVDPADGEAAVVLYDFTADGEDELTVHEEEHLIVLERDNDEWWKCRNATGAEGVVPASYVELVSGSHAGASAAVVIADHTEDATAIATRAAEEAEKRAEAQRREEARTKAERDLEEKEREKERKKMEAEQRAKAAAAAAEADRKRREREREKQKEKERAAAEEEAQRKNQAQRESAESSGQPSRSRPNRDSSSGAGRSSTDSRRGPPSENLREWHDRTGQFRVDAAFLGFANGKLRLHKVNGVVIEVPSEKMSAEDMRYVEKLTAKKSSPPRKSSDDDEPLELRRRSLVPEAARSSASKPPQKKGPSIDWFEFFLNAGCDVDDCTRYASSFERDKIDEALLPDITESTMRSLGLREGDIIRVKKAIDQRQPKGGSSNNDQLHRDEELARQLQAEETGGSTRQPAPNLFAGPNGALKNSSMRRGRPQPSKSVPPSTVDLQSITTASDQIQRTGSPMVASPETMIQSTSSPPQMSSKSEVPASAVASGFDDDAWTNRPSSTKPLAPTPPVLAPRAPSAPPAPPPPPAPAHSTQFAAPAAPAVPVPPARPQSTGTNLAKTTENDVFDQLARLSQLRTQSPMVLPPAPPAPARTPSLVTPPIGYQSGMGMGASPVPLGHLQAQQTGMLPTSQPSPVNGPRGPYAPVPANQSLLQPLVPTTTGFAGFVSTRAQNTVSPFQLSPAPSLVPQPSFAAPQTLLSQPTGFAAPQQPLMSQPTGFINPGPMLSQPTGMPNGNFGLSAGGYSSMSTLQPNGGFGQIQSNPTGFNPGFGHLPMNSGFSSPAPAPPVSSAPPVTNTSPANVFAQMKSGTFANDETLGPQYADKYDALRPNPSPLTIQPTGWGYQGTNGFQGGYGYQ